MLGMSDWEPIIFPEHALLIVEERQKEQQAEGVRMPEGMPLDELALRVLIAAEVMRRERGPLGRPRRPEQADQAVRSN
jgi:hypothetical protein